MKRLKQIVFTKLNTAEFLDMGEIDFSSIKENEVAVKSYLTTVSAGTERANITGNLAISDEEKARLFPRSLGYNCAGEVVAIGSAVDNVKIGDKVIVYWSQHKNYNVVDKNKVVRIDDDSISMKDAAISFIATFPLAAIRKLKIEIGESLLIMGLGILGQIAAKLAKIAGACPIIACDPIKERREEALQNGADYAFDPFDKDFANQVKRASGGGVKTAIEVTGVGAGLDETLDCMKKFGRIALLGCTRKSDFTIDYYNKVHCPGITLIGAHTNARAELESTHGNYTHVDDIKTVLLLLKMRGLSLSDIISETHSPENCAEVYERLINDKSFPIGVQFDWSLLDE